MKAENLRNFFEVWKKITVKAWQDETFKQQLLTHPEKVLKDYGADVHEGDKYVIHENTPSVYHFTILYPSSANREELKQTCNDKVHKAWIEINIRAWKDEVFKQRLVKNTAEVLKEYGFSLPSNIIYKVHENTKNVHHLSLLQPPELTEQEIRTVSGGRCDSAPGRCAWDGGGDSVCLC